MSQKFFFLGVIFMINNLFGGSTNDSLKEGSLAPKFVAVDQNNKTVKLEDYLGKQNVVLYFYPKDDTPGCTAQACSLRDGFSKLTSMGAVILGVSADTSSSHKAFAEKYNLPFSLLADSDKELIKKYDVAMPLIGIAKRVTFIIGKDGMIKKIFKSIDTSNHDDQVIEALEMLK